MRFSFRPTRTIAILMALSMGSAALAHHGWSWTSGENIEVTGTITKTDLGNPHGEIVVKADDAEWTVEVGQPWRNARSGLEDGDLAEGVVVTIDGEPASDGRKLMKAERLTIDGRLYDLYPGRS